MASEAAPAPSLAHRLATWTLWLLLFAVPFVLDSAQKDAFRLPKALLGESLALLSLCFLAFAWGSRTEWRRLVRAPFVAAFGPFVAAATLLSLASPHVAHVHRGLVGLWIGALAIWGWSAGFSRRELRHALRLQLIPASILAAIAILQFHGLYQPYRFVGIVESSRFAVGSLAGNVGDLAAALVLPAVLAQAELARGLSSSWRRWRVGLCLGAVVLCCYGLAVTQTFAALVALAAGSAVFWAFRLPRRRALAAAAGLFAAVVILLALVAPLRERTLTKLREIGANQWNSVLTGRLDGWRAAVWMVQEHPLKGVGVGAYRTEFIRAKTELVLEGVPFFKDQQNVVFANAHNELLEVAAETGWPGLATFLFGLVVLVRRLLRWRDGMSQAVAWGGSAAIAVLSLANFPFRIAIAFWPICLFVAWLFCGEGPETFEAPETLDGAAAASGAKA